MKVIFRLTKLFASIACILIIHAFRPLNQSEDKIQEIKNKLVWANETYQAENLYLHLDRRSYWANDDLWFKAYLESKTDSSNFYVELISPTGKILQKKLYLAIEGIAYGDFHLPDTISSGVYQIRAYTNWMRNFDETSFFHKNFIIWNIKEKNIQNNEEEMDTRQIDFQFFPESGILLSGMKNKLGFKAVDENGVGIDVSGVILDDQGAFVTFFKSLYKGMGSAEFIPLDNQKYTANITVNEKTIKVDLPKPVQQGVILSVETRLPDELRMAITERTLDTASSHSLYYLVGQIRGNLLFAKEIKLSDGQSLMRIPKSKIPTGILQLTLFDEHLIPKCERLAFINNNDYVHLNIATDKTNYTTREEVLVDITSRLRSSTPTIANLSLSVFSTENQLQLEEYPNNILTQFLLLGDLKGRIEGPAYYFKDDSLKTISALDNLILTQGWRRFSWQAILNNEPRPMPYQHQSSIWVEGKVTTKFFEKPLPNSEVTLVFDQKAFLFDQTTTDSLGKFCFNNLFYYDETSILLQAKREDKKKNIWLEVDESSTKSPEVKLPPVGYILDDEKKVNTTYVLSQKDSSVIQRKWHISDTILLDDIDIYGRMQKQEIEEALLYVPNPDKTAIINHDEVIESDIFDYIESNMSGIFVDYSGDKPVLRVGAGNGPAYLLLDGIPTDIETIETLAFSEFKRVDAQRFAPMYGINGSNGVINFTRIRGIKNAEVLLPSGVEHLNLQGYAIIREFYSPNYKNAKHSIEKTDFRSTLFWHPNIWTNADGNATVSYYNSDQPGEVYIVVEGFTTDGHICRGTYSYQVSY